MKTFNSIFSTLFIITIILCTSFTANAQVDAALFHHDRNVSYFFQGDNYYRLTGTKVDAGYPQTLPGGWQRLPSTFRDGIDAAFYNLNDNKIYMFKGDEFVRITGVKVDVGYPKKISKGWSGLTVLFQRGIDAAIYRARKIYFFKDGQYTRITGTKMDSGYPKSLPGGWGFPSDFNRGIDAAIAYKPNGKNYVFKGGKYARLSDTKLDSGYPVGLPGGWKGLKTHSSTNQLEDLTVSYWNLGMGTHKAPLTPEAVTKISSNSYSQAQIAESIFDIVTSVNGSVSGLFGPVGEIVGAAIDLAMELAKGIIKIVQKVRLENITHISAYTSVKGSTIKVIDVQLGADRVVQKDMLVKFNSRGTEGDLVELSNAINTAKATCSNEVDVAGFGLNIYPKGGGGIDPSFIIQADLGGKKYVFNLKTFNRAGTGTESKYTLSMLEGGSTSPLNVTFKTGKLVGNKTASFGNYTVTLKLRHANNDNRKDLVLVSFASK